MALTEYRLNPQSIDASGGVMTIVVHNYGRLTHDLVVSRTDRTIAATKPIAPGQTAELDLDLAPGTYLMASTILSDQALGAYGTLKSAAGSALVGASPGRSPGSRRTPPQPRRRPHRRSLPTSARDRPSTAATKEVGAGALQSRGPAI